MQIRKLFFFFMFAIEAAQANTALVEEDFLELRTGPGDAYPVFYTAEKGEQLEFIKRTNNWMNVKLGSKISGWIKTDDVFLQKQVAAISLSEMIDRKSLAINFGWFDGSGQYGISLGYRLRSRLTTELEFRDIVTGYSSSLMLLPKLNLQLYQVANFNPFVELGLGLINTRTNGVISQGSDFSRLMLVGTGVRYRALPGFFFSLKGGGNFIQSGSQLNRFWDVRLEFESLF